MKNGDISFSCVKWFGKDNEGRKLGDTGVYIKLKEISFYLVFALKLRLIQNKTTSPKLGISL